MTNDLLKDLINMKRITLGKISDISTGVVLRRKEASEHNYKELYKQLTVKSLHEDGYIIDEELNTFYSSEKLDSKYLTQLGDIIIRLSSPNIAVTIDNRSKDLVISSLFARIRLESDLILAEYLSIFINSKYMKSFFERNAAGVVLKTIKTSALKEIKINILPVNEQKRIIDLYKLTLKEKTLFMELMELKKDYYDDIIASMIEGKDHE